MSVDEETLEAVGNIGAKIGRRFEERIQEERETTDARLMEIEARVNTARHGRLGPGDNLLHAIPPELRKHIEYAAAQGVKDPVHKTALGLWVACHYKAKMAAFQGGRTSPGDWLIKADNIEKAWGYEPVEKAALGEATAGGGSIVATPVEAEILRVIADNSIMRPLVTKIVMSGPTVQIPIENSNVIAYIVPEATTITDSIPATNFASKPLTNKAFAGLATVSNQLFEDNIAGLNDYLFTAIGERIGILEDIHALEGGWPTTQNFSGVAVAPGVNAFTISSTSVTGGNIPSYSELVQLVYTAQQQSTRRGAGFFMLPNAFKNIVSLVDTTGQPIFSFANVPNAIPNFIGGYPVYLVSSLSTQWANGSNGSSASQIYFGPPSRLIFGDIMGMRMDIDPYGLFSTLQTRVRVLKRTGIICPTGGHFTFARGVKWF
jgi:HK97 family phage major capsid protein